MAKENLRVLDKVVGVYYVPCIASIREDIDAFKDSLEMLMAREANKFLRHHRGSHHEDMINRLSYKLSFERRDAACLMATCTFWGKCLKDCPYVHTRSRKI